jgi:hypothetical protein
MSFNYKRKRISCQEKIKQQGINYFDFFVRYGKIILIEIFFSEVNKWIGLKAFG